MTRSGGEAGHPARHVAGRVRAKAQEAADTARTAAAVLRSSDPPGTLLAVCTGHRCAGLQRLAGRGDPLAWARGAVSASSGAVLVSTGCLGACEHAPVALAALHLGASAPTGPTVWLAGLDDAERTDALSAWVRTGGRLPDSLAGAILGPGPALRLDRAAPERGQPSG